MNLKGKRICDNCFAEIKSEPCKMCSYKKSLYHPEPGILPVGTVLKHRYHIGHVLGRGGFGITYKAYDSQNDVSVAIKEYYPNGIAHRDTGTTQMSVTDSSQTDAFKNGADKFFEEAKTVSRFNGNPNIVNVYEFFYENSTVYYVMEYLEGCDLKYYIKNNGGKISQGKVMTVLNVVTDALVITHSLNVLHRDISPDNIFIQGDGSVKLIDFGAARQVLAEQSKSLSVILKQGFAPLEQYQRKGKQGPWTDIYALGATCLYALTGVIPDDATERIEEPELGNASDYGIDEDFWKIIEKCLAIRTADRYQNVLELKQDLAGLGIVPEPLIKEETDIPLTVAVPFGDTGMSEQALVHTYVPQEVLNNTSEKNSDIGATILHTENADVTDAQNLTIQNTGAQPTGNSGVSNTTNEESDKDEEGGVAFFRNHKLIIMIAIFLIIVIIIIAVVFVVVNSRNNSGIVNQPETEKFTHSENDATDKEETGESSGEDVTETVDETDDETDDIQPSESEGEENTEDMTTGPSQTAGKPTDTTTQKPTQKPTETPTQKPTQKPTETQTQKPTQKPMETPTQKPTQKPTEAPTQKPTQKPTEAPTQKPTQKPTEAPTQKPTEAPTQKPTEPPTTEPVTEETYVYNRYTSVMVDYVSSTNKYGNTYVGSHYGYYTGEWKDGCPNGKGYFIDSRESYNIKDFTSYTICEGEWVNGYLHGNGTRLDLETMSSKTAPTIYTTDWSVYIVDMGTPIQGSGTRGESIDIVYGVWDMGAPATSTMNAYAGRVGSAMGNVVGYWSISTNGEGLKKESDWNGQFTFDSAK